MPPLCVCVPIPCDLSFQTGMKPVEVWSPNHGLTRESPNASSCCCYCCQVTSVVSDSVRPHRRQPTRLPRPRNSPGKKHRSGLPFPSPMHESEKVKWSRSVLCDPQRPHGPQLSRLLRPWDFPGKSTGVGCHCLLLMSAVIPRSAAVSWPLLPKAPSWESITLGFQHDFWQTTIQPHRTMEMFH